MRRRSLLLLLVPLALVVFLAVFVGPRLFEDDVPGEDELQRLAEEAVNPGRLEVWGAWEGNDRAAFEAVLDGFMAAFPGTEVAYVPLGDELEERVREAAAEQELPALAVLPGTRLPQELDEQGLLLPLDRIEQETAEPFGDSFAAVGGYGDEEPFGVMVKPQNESLVWHAPAAYEEAEVGPAADWDELLANADALTAAGFPAYSVPGAEGAAIMDVFETILLEVGGADFYDLLVRREVPWTHETVVESLGSSRGSSATRRMSPAGSTARSRPTWKRRPRGSPPTRPRRPSSSRARRPRRVSPRRFPRSATTARPRS